MQAAGLNSLKCGVSLEDAGRPGKSGKCVEGTAGARRHQGRKCCTPFFQPPHFPRTNVAVPSGQAHEKNMEIMEYIYGEHRRSCSKTLSIAGYVIS